jgi:diguanylate cyclase (GGDEF)-like protein/PAS domain S-box-containing protein
MKDPRQNHSLEQISHDLEKHKTESFSLPAYSSVNSDFSFQEKSQVNSRSASTASFRTILLVGGLPATLEKIIPILISMKFDIRLAPNENIAIQIIQDKLPDLILINTHIPGEDGYAICARLKSNPDICKASIALMENNVTCLDKNRARHVKADDYFPIVLEPVDVINRIEKLIRLKSIEDLLEHQHAQLQNIRQEYNLLRNAFLHDSELAQVTLESIADAVVTTDHLGIIQSLNSVAENLTGWMSAQAIGHPAMDIFRVYNELTGLAIADPIALALRENRTVVLEDYSILISRDGTEYPISDSVAPIRDRKSNVIGSVLVFRDVSDSRRLARHLSWQATHDELTQLLNRGEFERKVSCILNDSRQHDIQSTLCFLDLDQFKVVNDSCGHAAGDELLRQLTLILKKNINGTSILARLGGDEFGLVFPGKKLGTTWPLIEKLLQAVQSFRFVWQGKSFSVSVSIGVVVFDQGWPNFSEVMSAADSACFAAKEQGRNCIYLYQSDDQEMAKQRNERHWISRINRALDESRFCLFSQEIRPLMQKSSGNHNGHYEILLRLVDEQGHLVPPMAFIPAAERYNLMPSIDFWVIKEFLSFWRNQSKSQRSRSDSYAINLSGVSISNSCFMDSLRHAILESTIPPYLLCFEITETAAISNLTSAVNSIQLLKEIGCSFALDDFGSGVSSLTYLKTLPVDYLKIDGSFIRTICHDLVNQAMVESFNRIAHVMGIQTVAEFVESQEILDVLQSMDVDYVQGNAISMPKRLCHV